MKKRIDLLLVEKNFFQSRQKAQAAIMSGIVKVDDKVVDKPGTLVKIDKVISFKKSLDSYVSRGGYKLEKALNEFSINLNNRALLDIGASTGGFTDCALRNGAKHSYCVDVGYGQLDWKLRSDDRVTVLERTNARYLNEETLYKDNDFKANLCVIDVSFISLKKIIPNVINLLERPFELIALIKPQFEVGKEEVSKNKGVIKSKQSHISVINDMLSFLNNHDLNILGLTFSPIKGPSGNVEFLVLVSNEKNNEIKIDVTDLVSKAHICL